MRKVSLRSLWGHKRRLVSTVLSVLLGVAFMSGTLMFSDTIGRAFDDLFASGTENIDAVVQGQETFSTDFGGDQRAGVDPAVLDAVQGAEGVAAAAPYAQLVTYSTQLLDRDGEAVGTTQGPPTIVESWVGDDGGLNPYVLTEGSREPTAAGEVAINVLAAEDGRYEVGDTVTIATQEGRQEFVLVGTFTFGDASSSGGAVSLNFSLDETFRLAGTDGKLTTIFARAEEGTTDTQLVESIAAAVPDDVEVLTGTAYGEQTASSIKEGFAFFSQILVSFAFLALLVGMFIIYNTFQILLAQRTRELALLRAVGASRRQVLTSVLLEAVVVAAVAALLGLVFGYLLATAVFNAFGGGGELPVDGIAVVPGTLVTGFLVGFIVTLLAALAPAFRATRVPPLAAMRDVAIERNAATKWRLGIGVVLLLLAATTLAGGWSDDPDVASVAFGGVQLIVASIVLGPALVTPTIRLFGGWVPRVKGTTGRLAFENAARNPKRTAATASALVIAVALIGFINIVAASAKESVTGRVSRGFSADVYVQGGGGFTAFTGFAPELAERIAELPGVDFVSTQKITPGGVQVAYPDGETANTMLGSADPETFSQIADVKMAEGEITDLTDEGIVIDRQAAENNDIAIGDELALTFGDGDTLTLPVQAISDDFVALFPLTVTNATFAANASEDIDYFAFVKAEEGADIDALVAEIDELADEYPNVSVEDQEGFIGSVADQITGFVTLIQGLLALSVLIAFIGIANTLSLSIHERIREIGLLRAVGATRGQLRATMRWEAAIIAVLGTVVGLGLSLVVSRAVIEALSNDSLDQYKIPVGTLGTIVLLAAGISIVASLRPAFRAADLNVLEAIAYD